MLIKKQYILISLVGLFLSLTWAYTAPFSGQLVAQDNKPDALPIGQQLVTNTNLIRPGEASSTASHEPVAMVMSENFEGGWPAVGWDLDDYSDSDGGEFLWGKRSCHPHTGSFAGWAVGGGAQGGTLLCSGTYPNNTYTWAVYGPFNLSNATAATLTYSYWGRTEFELSCNYDLFFVGSSVDNYNFSGSTYCGDWTNGTTGNGYYQGSLNLSNRLGQNQVWVAFVLSTDSVVVDIGITIDDVILDVTEVGQPTNTPTSTPQTSTPTATPPINTPTGTAVHGLYLPYIDKPIPPTPTPTSTPTITPTPTDAPPGMPVPGEWSGITSRDHPISFQVSANSTQWNSFSLTTDMSNGGCSSTLTVYVPGPGNITNSHFSGNNNSFFFTGTFTASNTATGTYNFINQWTGCGLFSQSGTWVANP